MKNKMKIWVFAFVLPAVLAMPVIAMEPEEQIGATDVDGQRLALIAGLVESGVEHAEVEGMFSDCSGEDIHEIIKMIIRAEEFVKRFDLDPDTGLAIKASNLEKKDRLQGIFVELGYEYREVYFEYLKRFRNRKEEVVAAEFVRMEKALQDHLAEPSEEIADAAAWDSWFIENYSHLKDDYGIEYFGACFSNRQKDVSERVFDLVQGGLPGKLMVIALTNCVQVMEEVLLENRYKIRKTGLQRQIDEYFEEAVVPQSDGPRDSDLDAKPEPKSADDIGREMRKFKKEYFARPDYADRFVSGMKKIGARYRAERGGLGPFIHPRMEDIFRMGRDGDYRRLLKGELYL